MSSDWSFNISKTYDESNIYSWSEPHQSTNITRQGIGEGGSGFVPSADLKALMEKLLKEENYNLLASDMISLHRSVPDTRPEQCKNLSYPEKLPNTSVIIIFHNEAWTTILRTVWSVFERSPPELINEIILVDDVSTMPSLQRPLDDYIEQIPIRIKLIRTTEREGLIRARLIGAEHATVSYLKLRLTEFYKKNSFSFNLKLKKFDYLQCDVMLGRIFSVRIHCRMSTYVYETDETHDFSIRSSFTIFFAYHREIFLHFLMLTWNVVTGGYNHY